jgi:hypothetical protein
VKITLARPLNGGYHSMSVTSVAGLLELNWIVTLWQEDKTKQCGLVLDDDAVAFGPVNRVWHLSHLAFSGIWCPDRCEWQGDDITFILIDPRKRLHYPDDEKKWSKRVEMSDPKIMTAAEIDALMPPVPVEKSMFDGLIDFSVYGEPPGQVQAQVQVQVQVEPERPLTVAERLAKMKAEPKPMPEGESKSIRNSLVRRITRLTSAPSICLLCRPLASSCSMAW